MLSDQNMASTSSPPPLTRPTSSEVIRGEVKQSRRLPYWLWIVIAKSLGIKLHPKDKPIVSAVMHVLTLGCGAGMVFMNGFYCGYDIPSVNTPTDVLDGCVSILMTLLYAGVGVYAHRLAYRLFMHPKFLANVRLHSKTIFKVNAALVIFIIVAAFVVVQNITLAKYMREYQEVQPNNQTNQTTGDMSELLNPCQNVEIPVEICQSFYLFQMIFSLFFLIWNVLVAMVLVSVARTHTIDIRRFMLELAYDAHLQDQQFRKNFYDPSSCAFNDNLRDYLWLDNDRIGNDLRQAAAQDVSQPADPEQIQTAEEEQIETEENVFNANNVQLELSADLERDDAGEVRRNKGKKKAKKSFAGSFSKFHRLEESVGEKEAGEENTLVPHIMTEQEMMHKYWKLASSTRLTSVAFQRWMCSLTAAILFWSFMQVVNWLLHSPNFYDVFSFILPLLLLPLLSSAYAEVNYEGVKVIQSMMPTPSRIHMFQYLYGMPIQMTAYGHRISYGTMGTVLAAIMAAFASKIMLEELNGVIKRA